MKKASTTLSHIPHHNMRCTISNVAVSDGMASPTTPTSANSIVHATNNPRFTVIPASETMMSPLRYCRYLRGLTGTGFAAPKGGAPILHNMNGTITVIRGSMCFRGLSVSRPSM